MPTATIERGPAPTVRPSPGTDPNRLPPAPTVPAPEAGPGPAPARGGGRGLVLPIMAVVLLLAVIGVGIAVIGGGGDGRTDALDGDASPTTFAPAPTGPDTTSRQTTTTRPVSTTSTTSTTTTLPASRPGRLYAGVAVLRDAPSLGAGEVRRLERRDGLSLEVLEEATVAQPWYRIRIDGAEGYMFGAFVLPPAPGLCVAVANGTPRFYDEFGTTINAEASGEKVLITGFEANGSYPVVLPGGQRGFVSSFDVGAPTCG